MISYKKQKQFHNYETSNSCNRKRKLDNDNVESKPKSLDLSEIYKQLNKNIYGMDDIKTYIIENLNQKYSKNHKFCLIGNNGKTTFCKELAKILGYEFQPISALIFKDIISISNILYSTSKNKKIIMIYDLEDVELNIRTALFNITTPTWIIYCMSTNIQPKIKMDILMIKPYTNDDITKIVKHFILPHYLLECGLNNDDISIDNNALDDLLMKHEEMNDIEKTIQTLVNKLFLIHNINCGIISNLDLSYTNIKYKFPIIVNRKLVDKLFPNKNKFSGICNYLI